MKKENEVRFEASKKEKEEREESWKKEQEVSNKEHEEEVSPFIPIPRRPRVEFER